MDAYTTQWMEIIWTKSSCLKKKNSMQQNWIRDRSEYETHELGHMLKYSGDCFPNTRTRNTGVNNHFLPNTWRNAKTEGNSQTF